MTLVWGRDGEGHQRAGRLGIEPKRRPPLAAQHPATLGRADGRGKHGERECARKESRCQADHRAETVAKCYAAPRSSFRCPSTSPRNTYEPSNVFCNSKTLYKHIVERTSVGCAVVLDGIVRDHHSGSTAHRNTCVKAVSEFLVGIRHRYRHVVQDLVVRRTI